MTLDFLHKSYAFTSPNNFTDFQNISILKFTASLD